MTPDTPSLASIDENARRRFKAAWRDGRAKPIEAFLPSPSDPLYRTTLEELVHIELEDVWKLGQSDPPRVEAYVARFPDLDDPAIRRRLIQQEWCVRHRFGAPQRRRCPTLDPRQPCVPFEQLEKRP